MSEVLNREVRSKKEELKHLKSMRKRMFLLKITNPKSGFYERLCLANGYSKRMIKEMSEEFGATSEEACEEEVSYWE